MSDAEALEPSIPVKHLQAEKRRAAMSSSLKLQDLTANHPTRFNGRQKALVIDTFALLRGFADGRINLDTGQPRIAANLIELLSDFSGLKSSIADDELATILTDALRNASYNGLTVDGPAFESRITKTR